MRKEMVTWSPCQEPWSREESSAGNGTHPASGDALGDMSGQHISSLERNGFGPGNAHRNAPSRC